MASRARSWRSWGAGSAWLLLAGVIAPEVSAGPPELPAGGLVLVANGHIVPEQQDVFISPERIRLVYAFKNSGETDASMLVTFALPELDMTWIWEQPPALPRTGDPNFVDAVTTADGLNVTYRMDQRAYSLGLDVTDALKARRKERLNEILSNQTHATAQFNTGAIRHTLVGGLELTRERQSSTNAGISGTASGNVALK